MTPGSQAARCGKIEVGDTVSAVNDWRIGVAQSVEGILPGAPETPYIDVLDKIRNAGRPMRLVFYSWRQRQRFDRLLNLLIELAGGGEPGGAGGHHHHASGAAGGGHFGRSRASSAGMSGLNGRGKGAGGSGVRSGEAVSAALQQQSIGAAEINILLQLVGRPDGSLRDWYWSDAAEQAGAGAAAAAAASSAPESSALGDSAAPGRGAGISWHHVASALRGDGELYCMYRYISRESCSQFDSLPLTSLTISGGDAPFDSLNEGSGIVAPRGVACAAAGADATPRLRLAPPRPLPVRWACTACGYKNKEAQVVCGVCDTRAPDPSRRSFEPWSCASVGPMLRPLL